MKILPNLLSSLHDTNTHVYPIHSFPDFLEDGLVFHVDGAIANSVCLSSEGKQWLTGVQRG